MFENNLGDGSSGPGTVVGANVKLTGTISDVNDITVHGTIEGEIISDKTVVISETAAVKGPITAQIVSVSGRVDGAIVAHQKLELLPASQIKGSIHTQELLIKSGAIFNGKCAMSVDGIGKKLTADQDENNQEDSAAKADQQEEITDFLGGNQPARSSEQSMGTAPTFELED